MVNGLVGGTHLVDDGACIVLGHEGFVVARRAEVAVGSADHAPEHILAAAFGQSLGILSAACEQEAVAVSDSIGYDGAKNVLLGVCERGVDALSYDVVLGAHKVPCFAVGIHSLAHHTHYIVVYLPFEQTVAGRVDNTEGIGLADIHSRGGSDIYVGHVTGMQRAGTGIDALASGEFVLRGVLAVELDRYREGELACFLCHIEHTRHRAGTGTGKDSVEVLSVVARNEFQSHAKLVVVGGVQFLLVFGASLKPGV